MDPIPSDADDTSKLHKTQVHNNTKQNLMMLDLSLSLSLSLSNLSFFKGLKLFVFGFPLMRWGEQVFWIPGSFFSLSPLATTLSFFYLLLSDCRRSKRLILIYLPSICNKQSQQEPGGHYLLTTHTTRHKYILSLLVLPTQGKDIVCLDSL
jgi:hypothetical protein